MKRNKQREKLAAQMYQIVGALCYIHPDNPEKEVFDYDEWERIMDYLSKLQNGEIKVKKTKDVLPFCPWKVKDAYP